MDELSDAAIGAFLGHQDGVISRSQAISCGAGEHDIRRLVRRNEWSRVHSGVYINHTGPLTWQQRAWAAVLYAEPAALCHGAARRAADGPGRSTYDENAPIDIAVDASRAVRAQPGIAIHRVVDLDPQVHWNFSPPRQRPEDAVLDLAAAADREIDAIAHLSDAIRARITTAGRLQSALSRRTRLKRRSFLAEIINDMAEGTCSALEHGYLVRVERAHGLPTGKRQFKESSKGSLYRDVSYDEFDAIIELDGRMFHSSMQDRDWDLERDLEAFATGRVTARVGWGQVFDRACATAVKVGAALNLRGWTESVRRCKRCA